MTPAARRQTSDLSVAALCGRVSVWLWAVPLAMGCVSPAASVDPAVLLQRLPYGGVQPRVAVASDGILHAVYLKGDPAKSDVYYTRRSTAGEWSSPVRVNSEAGSAIAVGTVRGAHVALGRGGRLHVAWNGSTPGTGTTFFYTRSNEAGTTFEPQRNLVTWASGLDGGGSIAADARGRVYVAWHAAAGPDRGDASRVVVLARSRDDGAHFAREEVVSEGTGVCACCALRVLVADERVWIAYRAARNGTDRDMLLLSSDDGGTTFAARTLDPWVSSTCPLSTVDLLRTDAGVSVAWERGARIRFQLLSLDSEESPGLLVEPPPGSGAQKHPVLARNRPGALLAVWTEGTGWNSGGSLAWQRYDAAGRPLGGVGRADGIKAWSLAAAAPLPDGRFLLLH